MNLKEILKKRQNPFPFPPPSLLFSPRQANWAFFLSFPREQTGPASPTRHPAGPAPPPSLFLFAAATDGWDPAVRPVSLLQPGQPRRTPRAAGRYRPAPCTPRLQTATLSRLEASPSLPPLQSAVTSLKPPPPLTPFQAGR
jgi:hypothetical protein